MPGPDDRRGRDEAVEWSFGGEAADGGALPALGRGAAGAAEPTAGSGGDDTDVDASGAGRRWAGRLAGALLAMASVGVAIWALRNERLHRRIQRDVQQVVALEAQAQRDGDREIYLGLQDESRRRQLRRPDQIASEAYAVGPYPGLNFVDDAPRVTAVEVAEAAAGGQVRAITATVRADATDGARIGRFEQQRRMVLSDDGRWLHAAGPAVGSDDVASFGSPWFVATFPAVDEEVLRPALNAAADAVESLCADTGRCEGLLRLAIERGGRGSFMLLSPSHAWLPFDAAARRMLAFSIARTAAIALAVTGSGQPLDLERYALVTAGLEVHLMRRLDPAAVAAWAEDDTAARLDLSLWHVGPFGLRAEGTALTDHRVVARSFVAQAVADDPRHLQSMLATWRLTDPPALLPTAAKLRSALGPDGLSLALNWPRPQAASPFGAPFVAQCEGFDPLLVDAGHIAAVTDLVCGTTSAAALRWHPTQPALAVACAQLGGDGEQPPEVRQIAVLRRGPAGRWAAERLSLANAPTDVTWSSDGRWLVWSAYPRPRHPDETWTSVRELWRSSWTVDAEVGQLGPAERFDAPRGGAAADAAAPASSELATELGVWSPDRRWLARVARPAEPTAGADAGPDAGDALWALEVLDATTGAVARRLALDEATLQPARRNAGHLALDASLAPDELAWSDDGRWLATTLPTAWRCANRRDCRLVVAWQPASDERHAYFNAPLEDDVDSQWQWRIGWLPGTTRLALHVAADGDGRPSGVAGEPDRPLRRLSTTGRPAPAGGAPPPPIDPAVAYVLDAATGIVERVPRSASDRLAPLLPNTSPDGRWRLRRDALDYVVAEPADAVGGVDADDPSTGWRLNRPFCSPFVLWGPPDA